jgi:hypothetical protein
MFNAGGNSLRLWVQTRRGFYQFEMASVDTRDVLVRGGRWFNDWTPVKLRGTKRRNGVGPIPVGLPLVLSWNDQTITTTPVISVEVRNAR